MRNFTRTPVSIQAAFMSLLGGLVGAAVTALPTQAFTITSVDFLGQSIFSEEVFPTPTSSIAGFPFEGTLLGGLSGITYNSNNNVYYSISDDRSQINPARFYTLNIDISDGILSQGDVAPVAVTTLLDANGQPFAASSLDPEGITFTGQGTVFISSEGDANALINPFVNEFSLTGQQLSSLPVAAKFLPTADRSSGIRNNLALESLTLTPDKTTLFTATENALYQDGPAATLSGGTPSRILKYDLATGLPTGEFLYETDPVALPSNPDTGFNTNGLVDLLALDDSGNHFLALERSFSTGAVGTPGDTGNTIKLYQVSLEGATDISGIDSLTANMSGVVGAQKELLFDFTDLGIPIDNVEGLTFGPTLADGRRSLLLVSDNNFSATQFSQVLAFGVEVESSQSVPEPSMVAGLALLSVLGIKRKQRAK